MTNKALDFTDCAFGLLVKRSEHWHQELCTHMKPKKEQKRRRAEIGIITDKHFYLDSKCGVICYPDVHWEGNIMPSSCHPANIVPFRKGVVLPEIEYSNE